MAVEVKVVLLAESDGNERRDCVALDVSALVKLVMPGVRRDGVRTFSVVVAVS